MSLRINQRYCNHCDEYVSYKTFKSHKRLYYNKETNTCISSTDLPKEKFSRVDSDESEVEDIDSEPASTPGPSRDSSLFDSPPCSNPALSADGSDESSDDSSPQGNLMCM